MNRCVCCGEIIPEGMQVCKSCENCKNKSRMTLEQYKAITDFAKENGYGTKESFLRELKGWGLIDERSPIEDLAEAVNDNSYETMYNYLRENYG